MEIPTEIKTINDLIFFGMLLMLILGLVIVSIFFHYQKRVIQQQRISLQQENEHQKQLLRASILGQERERNRLGKDMHDEVGALLTTTRLYFEHLSLNLDSHSFTETKKKAIELLDLTVSSVRSVSHDLRPVILNQMGLVHALESTIEYLEHSKEIKVVFDHHVPHEIDKEDAANWFRIIQELLNNTIKHAKAKCIFMHLVMAKNTLFLTYRDDGIGLGKAFQQNRGLGLQNIESRLSLMNGHLEIVSKQNQGLEFQIQSKLKPKFP